MAQQRGRKPASALAVVASVTDHRPAPPDYLTEADQRAEWVAIVRRLPANYFPVESHGLLAAYCRHHASFRILSASIDLFKPEWLADDAGLKRYTDLLATREREGRAMSSLATRLRITPASRYHPKTAAVAAEKLPPTGHRPWEHTADGPRREGSR